MNTDSAFKLGDLLDDTELGLELATADPVARERVVVGAHSIEVPRPAKWLEADWIMLTTGLELRESAGRQRELIGELCDAGVSALGFGVGVVLDAVPAPLFGAAEEAGFPIFTIPPEKPFREVARVVERSVLVEEARTFRRLCALQRFLLDSLATTEPEREIVERLTSMLDSQVAIVNRSGEVLLGRCGVGAEKTAAVLADASMHPTRLGNGDGGVWGFPLGIPQDGGRRWLVITTRAGVMSHLIKQSAHVAVPILEAVGRIDELTSTESKRVRSAALDALIDASSRQEMLIAAARAAIWGVDCEKGARLAIARFPSPPMAEVKSADKLAGVEAALGSSDVPWLASVRGDEIHVLIGQEMSDEQLSDTVASLHPDLLIGVGRLVDDPTNVRISRGDAELALRRLEAGDGERLLFFEDLDLSSSLIAEVDPERMQAKVERWLAPVKENPIVYEALLAYLDSDLDVSRTSQVLNLHPNSTRYRLARLEEMLGSPLRRPSTIAALHFALRAQEAGAARGDAID